MRYRTKVTLIFLAVVGITGGLLLWLSHRSARDLVFRLIQEKVLAVAVSTAPQIDGDAHARLTLELSEASNAGLDDQNSDYVKVRNPMRDSRDANRKRDDMARDPILPVRFIYTIRPRTDGVVNPEKPYEYVVDAEEEGEDKSYIGDHVTFKEGEAVIPDMGKARVDPIFSKDKFGRWLTAFAPVRDAKGNDVALLGVDIEADAVIAQTNHLLFGGLIAMLLAFVAAAVASIFLSAMVTAPLKALSKQVALIHEGDLATRIPVNSKDEIGALGAAIHEMADGLQERDAFKGALLRFVSSGKTDSVMEDTANGGESDTGRKVTVLVAGLREFDSISSTLPAEKIFAFLSDWYSTMIDVILRHRGSLEKSANESVTATFGAPLSDPDQERHALEAALTMERELVGLRRRWQIDEESGLSISAAIHTGNVSITQQDELQVIEFASLGRVIGAVSLIWDAPVPSKEGIVISEATADGLKGSIPLSYLKSIEVPGTGELLALHTVEMSAPTH